MHFELKASIKWRDFCGVTGSGCERATSTVEAMSWPSFWICGRTCSGTFVYGVCGADSGFCLSELLELWEQMRLPYVVVSYLSEPIQKLLKGDLPWQTTEVPGTEITEAE